MAAPTGWGKEHSPFHAGELAFQEKVGVREKMDKFARRVIRPYMPEQHRTFFGSLPYILAGSVDS